jgi:hypothetical protein
MALYLLDRGGTQGIGPFHSDQDLIHVMTHGAITKQLPTQGTRVLKIPIGS